jgi:Kef-type K+ transport system membrane component KefB
VGPGAETKADLLRQALVALTAIVLITRASAAACRAVAQPAVIGEMVGGIVIGASVLGRFAPGVSADVFPPAALEVLEIYAHIGVTLYLFVVGLSVDGALVRRAGHAATTISHASIVLPFVMGCGLALLVYGRVAPPGVSFAAFALFLGVSMSVTAFPVLARILSERGLTGTPLGNLSLTCAAVDDVTAWCLLALVVGIAQSQPADAVLTIVLTAAFIVVVLGVAAPIVRRQIRMREAAGQPTDLATGSLLTAVLGAATVAEYIGIHGFFGAFLVGAIIPPDSQLAQETTRRLDRVLGVLFLPVFFALTGMRMRIDLLYGAEAWLLCGAIIVVACAGKFVGSVVAARLSGISWRESAMLGVLMNTRGLAELIVLNVGLDLGILSPALFTMLVIMALVTTFMTTPCLQLLVRRERSGRCAPAASAVEVS